MKLTDHMPYSCLILLFFHQVSMRTCQNLGEYGVKDVSEVIVDDGARPSEKDEENMMISQINVSEGTTLEDFGLIGKEESMDDTTKYSSLHCEPDFGDPTAYGDNIVVSETTKSAKQHSDTSLDLSNSKNFFKDDECHPQHHPCGAWWKQRAAALYAHAKEANSYWSIFIAAAVMA